MTKPRLVLLHGANGSPAEIASLVDAMRAHFEVDAPAMLGHGGRPVTTNLTTRAMADDILAWMDQKGIGKAWVMGYSVGGLLALYLARHHPQRVHGAGALSAKVVFDEKTIQQWCYLASVERLTGRPRALELEKTHAPQDWRDVARMNQEYFRGLGSEPPLSEADFAAIRVPVILINSNRDNIAPWTDTVALGKQIPGSKLVMFYGIAHPLKVVPVHSIAKVFAEWTSQAPQPA